MTYGGEYSIEACKQCIKVCDKYIDKIAKEIEQWKKNKEDFQLSVSFEYKGYIICDYNDIDDLIANDVITSKQHTQLYDKLIDLRKTSDIDYKISVLEHQLLYWRHFKRDMINTKELEEERL